MQGFKYSEIYKYNGKNVLEVDILPGKFCNFDCVVCPYGSPLRKQDDKAILGDVDSSLQELNWRLTETRPDEVFLNSQGEALLSNCFDPVVDLIKRHGIEIRLMSNGYLFNHKDYRDTVNRIDEVVAEVDMVTEETFREIKRPMEHYTLAGFIGNLEEFQKQYPGKLVLDVGIMGGYNDDDISVKKLAGFIRRIRPDQMHVYRVENKKFRDRFFISPEKLSEIGKILNEALESEEPVEDGGVMIVDGNPVAAAAFQAFREGNAEKGRSLQQEFLTAFHDAYDGNESLDYCPLEEDSAYRGSCRECIAYHRGHMEQLPACMQPMLNRKLGSLTSR